MNDRAVHSSHQNTDERKITVIIADDHPIVRNGIKNELARHDEIEVISEADLGIEMKA